MPAFDVLRAYLEARASFSEDEMAILRDHFIPTTLPAGEFLQRAGDVARHAAFVATGCLRSYVIDANGKEHIVQFAPETWWLADAPSLMTGTPSQYFIDAVEDSDLLLIDPPSQQQLVDQVRGYDVSLRTGIQRHIEVMDQRIVSSLTMTVEKRYLEFISRYPSLTQRVPQWMVASYLGVSPETISRVRKNLSRR